MLYLKNLGGISNIGIGPQTRFYKAMFMMLILD